MPASRARIQLPNGRLTGAAETAALFPAVERQGLLGGALWHDAVMLSPERVAIEMLRWACACGASALNYVEATGLLVEGGAVRGILAHDRVGGRELRLRAGTVINAAGPWSRDLARRLGSDLPALFRPALAFNLLLDRPPLAEVAVAVEPRREAAPTYFCLPWKGLRTGRHELCGAARGQPRGRAQRSAGGRVPRRPERRGARPGGHAGRRSSGLRRPAAGPRRQHDPPLQPRGDPRSWRRPRAEGPVQRQRRQVHDGTAGRAEDLGEGVRPSDVSGAAGRHAAAAGGGRLRREHPGQHVAARWSDRAGARAASRAGRGGVRARPRRPAAPPAGFDVRRARPRARRHACAQLLGWDEGTLPAAASPAQRVGTGVSPR